MTTASIQLTPLSAEEAETITSEIVGKLDDAVDKFQDALRLIRDAIYRQAHSALDYRSPGEYISSRFGDALAGLGHEVRREVVRELSEAGLSSRAIAPVVRVSDRMVRRDLARRGNRIPTSQVVGLDGKSYSPPPASRVPRRRAITDQFQDAMWDLRKAVEKLEKLVADDRFPSYRIQMKDQHGRLLAEFVDRLGAVDEHGLYAIARAVVDE